MYAIGVSDNDWLALVRLRKAILKIESAARFDDFEHDEGYEYCGFNYVIRNEVDEFLVRTYDDSPGKATVVYPSSMYKNCKLKMLVDFLQCELGVSSIFLYKGEVGGYEEIEFKELKFKK